MSHTVWNIEEVQEWTSKCLFLKWILDEKAETAFGSFYSFDCLIRCEIMRDNERRLRWRCSFFRFHHLLPWMTRCGYNVQVVLLRHCIHEHRHTGLFGEKDRVDQVPLSHFSFDVGGCDSDWFPTVVFLENLWEKPGTGKWVSLKIINQLWEAVPVVVA